jgi:nicotinamidase-related amidase
MAVDLSELVAPAHAAVVTMELQRGVVGDLAAVPGLRDAADSVGLAENAGRLCSAARRAGARVVHCNAAFRADRQGSAANCRILAASMKISGDVLDRGMPGTENIPELAVQPSDLVIERTHGLTPFVATELDQLLRNMGITTVVATGNSLNVGVMGLVLGAVDLGYQVVVASDAVVGVPVDYGRSVMTNTISLLATVVSTDDLVAMWS